MALIERPTPYAVYEPGPEVIRATMALVNDLRRVTHPSRGWTQRDSSLPPGRLNATQEIQRRAQIANGMRPTAKPFRARVIDPVKHTPITCGMMFDASGSQGGVQEAVGVSRYVLTEALHRVGGTVAAVRFGVEGHPIQGPGDRLRKVEVYDAFDGWENYIAGFSLIDGMLNLIDGQGARMLFIVTDGQFNAVEAGEYAEVTMDMCRKAGVAVIWLDAGHGFKRADAFGHGEIVSIGGLTPVEVAGLLGKAVLDQFRRAAPQHGLQAA